MELGGFFELPKFQCCDITQSAFSWLTSADKGKSVFLLDGRTAIKTVLLNVQDKYKKEIYLPSYLCHAVIQPFEELHLGVKFYPHELPLKPLICENSKNAIIFIIDYFGTESIPNEQLMEFLDHDNIVIVDNTHSLLNSRRYHIKHENYFLIASIRKMFPIPDGGIVYHNRSQFKIEFRPPDISHPLLEAMLLKKKFLDCRNISQNPQVQQIKDHFLQIYRNHDKGKSVRNVEIREIPCISKEILKQLNIFDLIKKRQTNLDFLYSHISHQHLFLFNLKEIHSPFILPLIFKNEKQREYVKHVLIKNDIYPPIHWNILNVIPDNFVYEHNLSKRILSIPIDQRYNEKDLSKIFLILNDVIP